MKAWKSQIFRPGANGEASVLWLTQTTDYIDAVEDSLINRVLVPDFRFPRHDACLSMACLCARQGRYDEAARWFAAARIILGEQGWRTFRANADYVKR